MDNRAKGGMCDGCGAVHRKGTPTRAGSPPFRAPGYGSVGILGYHEASARTISAALKRPAHHTGSDAEARQAAAALLGAGVVVRRHHAPALTDAARTQLTATPWADDTAAATPGRQVRQLGAMLRLMERQRVAQLWARLPCADRTRLLSAGGAQTGMLWTSLPDPGQRPPDAVGV